MIINGIQKDRAEPIPLLEFLEQEGYRLDTIVVEHNATIITKDHFGDVVLSDADTLEIVSFVGGG